VSNRADLIIANRVNAVRQYLGLWLRDSHAFVRFTGPDAASWLHSQTTNDVEILESGEGHANALLDRQGRLQAHFTLHRWEDEYWMIVEKAQQEHVLQLLEDHLFVEDVTIHREEDELEQLVVQGPITLPFLVASLKLKSAAAAHPFPSEEFGCHPVEVMGHEALAFRLSLTGEDGYVFLLEAGEGRMLFNKLLVTGSIEGIQRIKPEIQEILRVEAGLPQFGIDMDQTCLIPETTLERSAISYEKGCYLGQEVVARLRAYGSVKQALMGLEFSGEPETLPEVDTPLIAEGKKIGRIMSRVYSPTLDASIALAYLDRKHRAPGLNLSFTAGPQAYEATVRVLPFVHSSSRIERAQELYEAALGLFEKDLDDKHGAAIPLLEEAILLDPAYEDAYEALGVILNRHQRVDEAIRYMRRLAVLNPECIMAHTNLSVFYVAKGMIKEAEEEKAKAGLLEVQKISDDAQAIEMAQKERKRLEQEAAERIDMFHEVLEIDPDDSVATFGLGKAYMQLSNYADAVPHLKKASEVQKDYSAAYLELGKCFEFLGQIEEAIGAYRQGIEAANRKGDLMPMREMERRLKAIKTNAAPAS
jgi:folate-binding protein YgfZ